MVYDNGRSSTWPNRPCYFSYLRIIKYKEFQLLALLSTLEQIACFLSLDCDQPQLGDIGIYGTLGYYFSGAAAGLVVLAFCSDCFVKPHMLFLPILVVNIFQLIFFLVCLIYGNLIEGDDLPVPFYPFILVEGFFTAQAQFYLLFLTPLRIADKYRLTQEVTPAGTIIATNICLTYLISSYVRGSISYLLVQQFQTSLAI